MQGKLHDPLTDVDLIYKTILQNIDKEEIFAKNQAEEAKDEQQVAPEIGRLTEKVRIEIDKDLNRTRTSERVDTPEG